MYARSDRQLTSLNFPSRPISTQFSLWEFGSPGAQLENSNVSPSTQTNLSLVDRLLSSFLLPIQYPPSSGLDKFGRIYLIVPMEVTDAKSPPNAWQAPLAFSNDVLFSKYRYWADSYLHQSVLQSDPIQFQWEHVEIAAHKLAHCSQVGTSSTLVAFSLEINLVFVDSQVSFRRCGVGVVVVGGAPEKQIALVIVIVVFVLTTYSRHIQNYQI